MTIRTDVSVRNYAPHQVMRAHAHKEHLMSIVINGGFRENVGRSERFYAPGHVAFFPAGLVHAQEFGAMGARQVIFRTEERWLDYLADGRAELDAAPYTRGQEFRLLGERLLLELGCRDERSEIACEGILLEIVAAFGRRNSDRRDAPQWLRTARTFLHDNVCRPLTLREIASAAGRHEVHLAREFRRHYGTSVVTYLRRLRVQQAAQALAGRKTELSEIAFDCGFSSYSHFSREFKLFYGVTPSTYRAQFGSGKSRLHTD